LLFIAESRKYHPVVVGLLLHNDKWLKNISTKFCRVLKQCSVFYFDIVSFGTGGKFVGALREQNEPRNSVEYTQRVFTIKAQLCKYYKINDCFMLKMDMI
jgi:hypothetical protein